MRADLHNDYIVDVKYSPKKQKNDSSVYDVYLLFEVRKHQIVHGTTTFATDISVPAERWGGPKIGVKGTTDYATAINDTLNDYRTKAKKGLKSWTQKMWRRRH